MPARARDNRTPDGGKKRWTPSDRAQRAAAPTGGARRSGGGPAKNSGGTENRAARRDDRYGEAKSNPSDDRRVDWYPGPRTNKRTDPDRSSRFRRDDRTAPPRDDRPQRSDSDSSRGDRRPASRDSARDSRGTDRAPRTVRDERAGRPARDDRPARSFRDDDARRSAPRDDREARPYRGGDARRPARDDAPRRPFRPQETRRTPRHDDRRTPREDAGRRPFRDDARGPSRDSRDRTPQYEQGRDVRTPKWTATEDVVLERLKGEIVTADEVAGASFAELGLGQQITRALEELGATQPFPIQSATIPHALAGRNVLGRGRTGSGKTIAFGAALVERLMRNWAESGRTGTGRRIGRPPRAIVLAPTRELALQIDRTVQPLARAVGLYTTQIVGGVPQARQVGALAKGVDIVIGTPGRIEDLLEQRRLDLSDIEIAVLDEADHMADLGFLEPMQRLLRRVPQRGQRMLFSATLDSAVSQLVAEFLPNPAVHEVADAEDAVMADHRVLVIEQGEKLPVLTALVASVDRSLVFARTRAFAEQLADDLDGQGVRAESLHGDLNQARRTRNLARFSDGKVATLVATDVAARGIHVDDIELVVHADSAEDYKTYLHRSGRTGRAGASGTVVTLITARRRRSFTELLQRAGIEAEFVVLPAGADPVAAIGR